MYASIADRITGSSVCSGEDCATCLAERRQAWRDQGAVWNHLHVAELAYVVRRSVGGRCPPDEDVRGALRQPLADGDSFARRFENARIQELLVDRRPRLLDLQEQRIGPIATLQQDEVDTHADASDADDLSDRIAEL